MPRIAPAKADAAVRNLRFFLDSTVIDSCRWLILFIYDLLPAPQACQISAKQYATPGEIKPRFGTWYSLMPVVKSWWGDNRFSPWVRSSLKQISSVPSGLALDIPCGRGRHSHLLMELGFQVMGADIDAEALVIAAVHPKAGESFVGVQLDALEPLPFCAETFDLLLVIHPHSLRVMSNALACLRIGGYLIYETFGAQGENWRLLPKASQISVEMLANFTALSCKEVRVKKAPNVVTSKGLFRKTTS